MSSAGTVFYVHGMGGIRPGWSEPLERLAPDDRIPVFDAPHYADLLDPRQTQVLPFRRAANAGVTRERVATERARSRYVERQRHLAAHLDAYADALPAGTTWPTALPHPARLPDRLPLPRVLRSGFLGLDQVGRYLDEPDRRAAVVGRLRSQLAMARPPVVVLAHSLGSVVALDLLADPPCGIALLVTIGSPAGHAAVAEGLEALDFPYDAVGGWVNVVHLLDPVPFGRGLSVRYPAALDVFLPALTGMTAALPGIASSVARAATAHLDTSYLASTTVQEAIALGLGLREQAGAA